MLLTHLLFAVSLVAPVGGAGEAWQADWDVASKLAKEQGKDLLVEFTGSDWRPLCMKLHEEVFKHEEFAAAASASFVLVALDYPRKEPALSAVPNKKRNAELAQLYKVQGLPAVVLMTADGEAYGLLGYEAGGAAKYATHVEALRVNGRKALAAAKELVARMEAATQPDGFKLLDEAIVQLQALDPGSPIAARLSGIVKGAYGVDPDNQQGRKLAATRALLAAKVIDDQVKTAVRLFDPKNEAGMLERVVQADISMINAKEQLVFALKSIEELVALGPIKDAAIAKQLYASATLWCLRNLNDRPGAKKWAERLTVLGIDEDDANLKQLVEQALKG